MRRWPLARSIERAWHVARAAPGALGRLSEEQLTWVPAEVPGTVAGAVREASTSLDADDWWFRTGFAAVAGEVLVLDGVATVADVFINGELVAHSESMFVPIEVPLADVPLRPTNELMLCCRALAPRLAPRRKPRARWRTRIVAENNLRFFRTTVLGRAPGFAPGPEIVGPWLPVRIARRGPLETIGLRAIVTGADGILSISAPDRRAAGSVVAVSRAGIAQSVTLEEGANGAGAEVRIADVALWWPHTHGEPALYKVEVDGVAIGRVGFRTVDCPADWEEQGFRLTINGIDVFVRGALWTPRDLTRPYADPSELRETLAAVTGSGMNMLRLPGIGCYESEAFHDLCDELGILVWQDVMLANLDYPDADESFREEIEEEVRFTVARLAGRPSSAVVCGGSEVAQQVTMLGLDPELARGPLYTALLPKLVDESGLGIPYVPNSPWGGPFPFRPHTGVANYYGVGGYRRPLSDTRLAAVKFAAECLAFANVPDGVTLEQADAWVPRDNGSDWDFADVRDHYLRAVYGEDPEELRTSDPDRYLELARMVTGEVMAEVLGEWRRLQSPCSGALILWLQDHRAGSGWGVIDHTGRPKAPFHHLRRILAPTAVWMSDEGQSGVAVHVANDGPQPLSADLRVAVYRDGGFPIDHSTVAIEVMPRGQVTYDLETLVGRFIDVNWTYRFGPPNVDTIVATLESRSGGHISQAFHFPVGYPTRRESADDLGLTAVLEHSASGDLVLCLNARRVVHGIRIDAPELMSADDAFSLEPGSSRVVALSPIALEGVPAQPVARVRAINLKGQLSATPLSDDTQLDDR